MGRTPKITTDSYNAAKENLKQAEAACDGTPEATNALDSLRASVQQMGRDFAKQIKRREAYFAKKNSPAAVTA